MKAATAIRRPLSVVEDAERCLVVVDGDAEDWLVSFTKADDFDAAAAGRTRWPASTTSGWVASADPRR